MDLNGVESLERPRDRAGLPGPRAGDAWLAGGTWLFSEPQPGLRRLIDLGGLGWPAHTVREGGLELAATCTFAELARLDLPAEWRAAPLLRLCCEALLGSFKIWNAATVGGNLCLALPAAPIAALATALEGRCRIWTAAGSERALPALDFVTGPQATALRPGEILRALALPAEALRRRFAFRRASLTPLGRSAACLIGTRAPDGAFALTVTASVGRPRRLSWPTLPEAGALRAAIEAAIPAETYVDDVHGRPDWRRHATLLLADEIRAELAEGAGA